MVDMTEQEKERLEENLTNLIGRALARVEVNISGRIVSVDSGISIVVETANGQAHVDINDGITKADVFKVGDTITGLPLRGAYVDLDKMITTFIFDGEESKSK